MNILITGVHGFVGSNLVRYFENKHTIYGIDIVNVEKKGVEKTFSWADLDNKKLPHIDVIIHLAGKAHDTKKSSNSQVYFDINTGLTKKIFDYYLQSEAKKFIFFSSIKAAADFVVGDFVTEDIIPNPKGPYGESKIKAEEYICSKCDFKINKEKSVYIFRPCMIHGPGNKGNLNLLYNVVKRGIPYPLGSFDNKRSFTSITNLSFIIDKFLDMQIESGIYNIADDDAISTNKLIKIISETIGKKEHILYFPKKFMNVVAKVGGALYLPLNTERLNKLTENYVVSNKKVKEAIDVFHLPIKVEDGLKLTIKSFINNK